MKNLSKGLFRLSLTGSLNYYKNAPDLNVVDHESMDRYDKGDRNSRNDRGDRGGRYDRNERSSRYDRDDKGPLL